MLMTSNASRSLRGNKRPILFFCGGASSSHSLQSFVGGAYLDRGLEVIKSWLHPLFRPYLAEAYRIVRVQHGLPPEPEPVYPTLRTIYRHVSLSPLLSGSGSDSSGTVTPDPVQGGVGGGVPVQSWSIPPPPRIPGNVGHLSLFNQHMQQQGKFVEWVYVDSEGEGTKTTPIWVVRAMCEGECLGRGRGSTKKAARNEAAKEGLLHLGIYVS